MSLEKQKTYHAHVHDEDELRRFATILNRDLAEDRVRLMMLLARRKYMTPEERGLSKRGGKSENIHLTRQLISDPDPDSFLRKVQTYEVPVGTYVFQDSGNPIPQACMALYVTLQPNSMLDATVAFQAKAVGLIRDLALKADGMQLSDLVGMESLFKGEIHKANAKDAPVTYIDLDVDTKDFFELEPLRALLSSFEPNPIVFSVLTRGGTTSFSTRTSSTPTQRRTSTRLGCFTIWPPRSRRTQPTKRVGFPSSPTGWSPSLEPFKEGFPFASAIS